MKLEEALYRAIIPRTNRPRTLRNEGTSVQAMIREIERALGGTHSDVAKRVGVPRTTWRNWRQGAKPKPEAFALLRRAQRRARLSAGREAFLRGRPAVRVYAEIVVSSDTRDRVLRVSTWNAWAAIGRFNPILDAWLNMEDTRAVDILLGVIQTEIGHHTTLTDVYDVRTFRTESAADHWAEGL